MQNLYETINTQKQALKNFQPEIFEIPSFVTSNLKYDMFEWQKGAFENFLFFEHPNSKLKQNPTHLMFNMATGAGKTHMMAGLILYFYEKGYRHFIFFVNQNNIVDKTENNFINSLHNKYLFKEKIIINDKTITIKKVDTFSDNPQNIEIKFTTIQKLYNDIHVEKENQTTLDDLHVKDIVMLADEAHHLNANTSRQKDLIFTELKSNASVSDVEKKGWEHTVIELILHKNGKKQESKNVLLEFTATVPSNEKVAKKYEDKIIYKFGLKEFLEAGYTKEINLISSTLDKKQRILQALLFNWYRHKIALRNLIANFKPVILFRSKTIEESKADFEEFLELIESLEVKDFDFLKSISKKIAQSQSSFEQGLSKTKQVLEFIEKENVHFGEIVDFIKHSFNAKNLIITNSKTNTAKTEKTDEDVEKLLNSLEDKNNHIRGIFTVNRLTEGWDVLNLFDIVRLYQGQNAGGSNTKTPEATTKEKQLIGRGVRYFPFIYKDKMPNKRKFDNDLKNELRVLEELYYYTYDEDSRYISELKKELRKDGYIIDDKVIKTYELKKDFKNSNFYKNSIFWYNEKILNKKRQKQSLNELKSVLNFSYKIQGLEISELKFDFKNDKNLQNENKTQTISVKLNEFNRHIFLKAISLKSRQNPLFCFESLRYELNINSIDDLLKKEFLGDFDIKIITSSNTKFSDISNHIKLKILLKFLENAFNILKQNINIYKGGEFKQGNLNKFFNSAKIKSIQENEESKSIFNRNLKNAPWYALDGFNGTKEEIALLEFIKNIIGNLEQRYDEFYLLRNEEMYKIYDFQKGRGFMPDFILFLKGKKSLNYQIFIEPKGDHLLETDKWKEDFLNEITSKYGFENIIKSEHSKYRLIGLPFFNESKNSNFDKEFKNIIN